MGNKLTVMCVSDLQYTSAVHDHYTLNIATWLTANRTVHFYDAKNPKTIVQYIFLPYFCTSKRNVPSFVEPLLHIEDCAQCTEEILLESLQKKKNPYIINFKKSYGLCVCFFWSFSNDRLSLSKHHHIGPSFDL